MPPVIDKTKCTKCSLCVQICPLDVIKMQTNGEEKEVVVKYPEECWHCRACVIDCPKGAIKLRYPLSHMLLHVAVQNAEGSGIRCK